MMESEPVREGQKKEDRRVRRTRKLLTRALTELLEKKQLKDISVKELTELADVNRGTFYLYYRDIFDMLEKIEDGLFNVLESIADSHQTEDLGEEVRPIMLDVFDFVENNQEICRVLLSENGDMSFLRRLNDVLREKCKKIWPCPPTGGEDPNFDYHYSFLVFGCAGLIRSWVTRGCPESAVRMAGLADAMIRRGSLVEFRG